MDRQHAYSALVRRTGLLGLVALVALIAPVAVSSLAGQDAGTIAKWRDLTAAVDELYADLDKPHRAGGITAVIYRGEILHLKGYGAANREFDTPWTPDTRYLIASTTKTITASAILALVDAGRVTFDDPLATYVPEAPDFDPPLTLRHLLTMTSGLWQDEILPPLAGVQARISLDEMHAMSMRQQEPDFALGRFMRYTDTNYRLLARVIAAVVRQPFPEALQRLLFRPLGMTSSLSNPDLTVYHNRQAPMYFGPARDDTKGHIPTIPVDPSGDGSVVTSMNDLIKWLLYMREGIGDGKSRWQRLDQPLRLGNGDISRYRLGVYTYLHRGLYGLSHGGITGTGYVFYPEIDLIVAFFNNNLATLERDKIYRGLTDAFLLAEQSPYKADFDDTDVSEAARPRPLSEGMVQRLAGTYADPRTGYFITLTPADRRLALTYNGAGPFPLFDIGAGLLKTDDADARGPSAGSYLGPNITLWECRDCAHPTVMVQESGWGEPRTMRRKELGGGTASHHDLLGVYYAPVLRAYYTVEVVDGKLRMRNGSGTGSAQSYHLVHLVDDVFEAKAPNAKFYEAALQVDHLGVRFARDAGGAVTGLRILRENVGGIDFDRIADVPGPARD